MNNESAFPVQSIYVEDLETNSRGMTLRDYFAAKVIQGICASGPSIDFSDDRLASDAYQIADAMLKVRNGDS